MRRGIIAATLAVLAGCVPAVAAAEREGGSVAAGLQSWLDGTRTLEGSFEQTLVSGALGTGLKEKGRVWLERPGRMRWDYTDPDPKIAIVDGATTLLYLPEDRQLVRGRLVAEQAALPELLASHSRLADLFEAEPAARLPEDPRGAVRLKLVPKRGSGSIERVVLLLDQRRFEILGADVVDAAGNRMTYRFSNWRRNRPIATELFTFEPPPGTEIVESE